MVSDQHTHDALGWCLVIPAEEAHRAAPLRHDRDIKACVVDGELWVRGLYVPENDDELLHLVPGARVFLIARNEQSPEQPTASDAEAFLVPLGKRVPSGRLPAATWRPLTEQLQLEFPAARSARAQASEQVPLQLMRSSVERVPNLLVVELRAWFDYVTTAPTWRLERWSFATCADGSVLIRGHPLPPLPGVRWVEQGGIAVPAGWSWHPPVSAAVLRRLLRLEPQDIALLRESESWQLVRHSDWVQASRSAMRLTKEAMHDRS